MQLLDVNVFVYLLREDAPEHDRYRAWFDALRASPEPFAVSEQVLASAVRIVINPRFAPERSTIDEALAFADAILAHTHISVVRPGEKHWGIFTRLCRSVPMRPNDIPDAWLAALAIEHGCELATADRGFARYKPVRYRHPLDD